MPSLHSVALPEGDDDEQCYERVAIRILDALRETGVWYSPDSRLGFHHILDAQIENYLFYLYGTNRVERRSRITNGGCVIDEFRAINVLEQLARVSD